MNFLLYISAFINLHYYTEVIKCRNYTLGLFVPEAKPRDTNITMGIISIWYFNTEFILNARSKAEGILPMNNTHFYTSIYDQWPLPFIQTEL